MVRLTDDELNDLLGCANDKYVDMGRRDVIAACAELRERRAADLTGRESEVLRKFRDSYNDDHAAGDAPIMSGEALAALDKLLAHGKTVAPGEGK